MTSKIMKPIFTFSELERDLISLRMPIKKRKVIQFLNLNELFKKAI